MTREERPGRRGGTTNAAQVPARETVSRRPGRSGAPGGRRRPLPRRERRGLINVMLTVAIAAIVVGAMIGIYVTIQSSVRTSSVQTTVTALESEIRRAFANRREYATGDYHDFLAPRMPSNAVRGAAGSETIVTPWGGEIEAGGGGTAGTAAASPDRFWIVVNDLPRDACITVAEALLDRTNIISVSVDGTATGTNVLIETNCDDADDNTVQIVYRG